MSTIIKCTLLNGSKYIITKQLYDYRKNSEICFYLDYIPGFNWDILAVPNMSL